MKLFLALVKEDAEKGISLVGQFPSVDSKGRYLHWDAIRYKTPPEGYSIEQWWAGIKWKRVSQYTKTPFSGKDGVVFNFASPLIVKKDLHWLDINAAGSLTGEKELTNPQIKTTYIIRSLINEAITSSQLEGATTTGDLAKEMIRTNRKPRDKSERMILNNYNVMKRIQGLVDQPLSPELIKELQRILTADTMEDDAGAGNYRQSGDNIHVFDNRDGSILFTPPGAEELPERMEALCDFANKDESEALNEFIHPVIKGIILHFMLAYNHPFKDGNGRTARALFYWYMAKQGYWLMEYISISEEIKKAPFKYGRAFLYTETDGNDLTYFIVHQLEVIRRAIDSLHAYLDGRKKEFDITLNLLDRNPKLRSELNYRQLGVLKHALKNANHLYTIQEHVNIHGVAYETARKDLMDLSERFRLLDKRRKGHKFIFISPPNLRARLEKRGGA